jgi:hypothetical protein
MGWGRFIQFLGTGVPAGGNFRWTVQVNRGREQGGAGQWPSIWLDPVPTKPGEVQAFR